ncbi:MAG: N-acetylmuramoyl-L-alanine amidase [Scytolyngbya sp. HA4215-MV1]|jgi:N-acetylmuramoyl-L-alanine amidase|nr:N-acetylmuramoyl-L-alanine amidase [Scytolyngbya sp. HA4215-MV1]
MRRVLGLAGLGWIVAISPVWAAPSLFVAYPPAQHETTANRIFLIGTAPPQGEVLINGKPIARNAAGHFAPSFPLQLGENLFTLRYGDQEIQIRVTRLSSVPVLPPGLGFAKDSLTPAVDVGRLPNEEICFGAIAPANAFVSVKLANQVIPLSLQSQAFELPENAAVLTQQNQPNTVIPGRYQGCTRAIAPGILGTPVFQLTRDGKTVTQVGSGKITILAAAPWDVAEVTAEAGVARTGPSTDYSRLTPLPKGTQATVTGYEGEWVRLEYGAWIKRAETRIFQSSVPSRSLIRSINARQIAGWTEVVFPLQVPVPVSVQQGDRSFTLTLYNTTAQTDIIHLDDDPVIARLDWQQIAPGQIQYTFNLKSAQQWGYKLRYAGSSLILSLRHPPTTSQPTASKPLAGVKILLDPGHGSAADPGTRGPTGYPEKDATLVLAKLVKEELIQRGAIVSLTREGDEDLLPQDRVKLINQLEPTLALSLHYNALPDSGDAIKTQGVAAFWYNAQAHSLAVFLHNYLVQTLHRSSYGVLWDNLALTRPTVAPSVLLELGFMINPDEFEWIINPQAQKKLATAIADGITLWLTNKR